MGKRERTKARESVVKGLWAARKKRRELNVTNEAYKYNEEVLKPHLNAATHYAELGNDARARAILKRINYSAEATDALISRATGKPFGSKAKATSKELREAATSEAKELSHLPKNRANNFLAGRRTQRGIDYFRGAEFSNQPGVPITRMQGSLKAHVDRVRNQNSALYAKIERSLKKSSARRVNAYLGVAQMLKRVNDFKGAGLCYAIEYEIGVLENPSRARELTRIGIFAVDHLVHGNAINEAQRVARLMGMDDREALRMVNSLSAKYNVEAKVGELNVQMDQFNEKWRELQDVMQGVGAVGGAFSRFEAGLDAQNRRVQLLEEALMELRQNRTPENREAVQQLTARVEEAKKELRKLSDKAKAEEKLRKLGEKAEKEKAEPKKEEKKAEKKKGGFFAGLLKMGRMSLAGLGFAGGGIALAIGIAMFSSGAAESISRSTVTENVVQAPGYIAQTVSFLPQTFIATPIVLVLVIVGFLLYYFTKKK